MLLARRHGSGNQGVAQAMPLMKGINEKIDDEWAE